MSSTKCAGLSYPTHILKSRGSVIRNNFLKYRTNKATHFARRNVLYALLAINKAKHIPNRLFSYSSSDTIYGKSIKNKFSFLKEGLPILKTACAHCMFGMPQNLVNFYPALKPRHRRTSTIVIESVS